MGKFEIYENNRENSSVIVYSNNKHDIYNYLINRYNIDEETAIEIDSWSELAYYYEKFITDDLTIICES